VNIVGPLTPRERRLVRVLASGATNREIADRLGVREQTVRNQLSRLYRRAGVRNRLELGLAAPRLLAPDGAMS